MVMYLLELKPVGGPSSLRQHISAMTLKIMCTYAHYVTLGSRCKMASNHRVTDLDKIPVQIFKDEAPTPL